MRNLRTKLATSFIIVAIILTALMPQLAFADAAAPTPTPLPEVGIAATTTNVAVTVNVRPNAQFYAQSSTLVWQGPGIGEVLAQLSSGAGVFIVQWTSDGQWANISDGTTAYGWVRADALSSKPRLSGSPVTSAVSADTSGLATGTGHIGTMYVLNTTSLRKRSGPGTNYAQVGSIAYGTAVNIIGWDSQNYWALTDQGYWLGSGFLSTTQPPAYVATTTRGGAVAPSTGCTALSLSQLRALAQPGAQFILQSENGQVAGVHMTFASDWQKQCWVDAIHKDESSWTYAPAGAEVTVWALQPYRPLQ